MARIEVPLRVVVENPPAGVAWAFQRSRGSLSDLAGPTHAAPDRLTFEFTLQAELAEGGVRWLGPGTQGPPTKRFFYLNSGTYAGEEHPTYGRRAKIPLSSLTWPLIESLGPGQRLELRIPGVGKDGGPTCATVKLPAGAWTIA